MKNNRDSLIHCCLSDANWWIWRRLLLQASGKISHTAKRKLYTKNKQACEELHLSLKGKGPYTIYKTDSNKMGLRSPNNAFYSKAEGTLNVKEEKIK